MTTLTRGRKGATGVAPGRSTAPQQTAMGRRLGRTAHAQRIAAATDPSLSRHRAATWIAQWDQGGRSVREDLLTAFLLLHRTSHAEAMVHDLGDAASLFFTRITTWFRLTYCKLQMATGTRAVAGSSQRIATAAPGAGTTGPVGRQGQRGEAAAGAAAPPTTTSGSPTWATGAGATGDAKGDTAAAVAEPAAPSAVLLMVQSLAVFVRGATYVTQLVESGMAAALTDCLERGTTGANRGDGYSKGKEKDVTAAQAAFVPLTRDERVHIVLLLLFVANSGRVYREMVCDEDGLLGLLHVLRVETDDEVAGLLTELLVLLGKGHPRIAPLVQRGLFRLIADYYESRAGAADSTAAGAPPIVPVEELSPTLSGGGHSQSLAQVATDTVVVRAAQALRGLQLHKETHHYSACQQSVQQQQEPEGLRGRGGGARDRDNPSWVTNCAFGATGVPVVDEVPVVCCGTTRAALTGGPSDGAISRYESHPLFRSVGNGEFVHVLFELALDDSTRLSVEGSELLVLVAKNVALLPRVLNRALDVLDDDMLVIADEEDAAAVARRHRRQLSCGRVAVQVMLTTPATSHRRGVVVGLIALRSAHMSLVKYLRLTDLGDSATVVDGCRALQLIARASEEEQRRQLQDPRDNASALARGARPGASATSILKAGQVIRDALGSSLYRVLLHEELTEEESFAMLRAARASATTTTAW